MVAQGERACHRSDTHRTPYNYVAGRRELIAERLYVRAGLAD